MNTKYCLCVICAVIFYSCTERIDLELNDDENQRLVVEGWITDQQKAHEVELTLTSSYFQNEASPRATGAIVSITDGDNEWSLTEEGPGIYRTSADVAGEPGKSYTLNIDYGGELYSATSQIREVAPIDSMAIIYEDPEEEFGFDPDPRYEVKLWTQEIPGFGDCYTWFLNVNGEAIRDTLSELSFVNDELYDGNYIAGVTVDILEFEEEAHVGDTVTVEQWNIGMDAYRVFNGILNETEFNGGIFDTPPANVESNISNGALGFFGAAGVTTRTTVIPE